MMSGEPRLEKGADDMMAANLYLVRPLPGVVATLWALYRRHGDTVLLVQHGGRRIAGGVIAFPHGRNVQLVDDDHVTQDGYHRVRPIA